MYSAIIIPLVLVISFAFYLTKSKVKNKNFGLTLKADCLKRVLKIFGDIEWLNQYNEEKDSLESIISDTELNKSGLFLDFNHRYTDDEFKGTYKGVSYKISETKMLKITGSGKNSKCIEVFKGVIIYLNFNKDIKNRTIVSTKGDMTKKNTIWVTVGLTAASGVEIFKNGFDWFGFVFYVVLLLIAYFGAKSLMKQEEALDEVTLEDTRFNKKYNVYSSDQVEARYLITPSFMQRFYNLQMAFDSKKIKCSFFGGNKFMVAISTNKDLFELGDLNHSLLDSKSHVNLYLEIKSILKIIDHFKLTQNIKM